MTHSYRTFVRSGVSTKPGQAHFWPLGAGAEFVGVEWNGRVLAVNERNGESRLIGRSGFRELNSLAIDRVGQLFSVSGDLLISIDPSTGAGSPVVRLDFGLRPVDVRGLAFAPDGTLFAINSGFSSDTLFTVDPDTGIGDRVGHVGSFMQSLEVSRAGILYTWSRTGLQTVDPLTGTATSVSGDPGGPFLQSLAFSPGGSLFGVAQRDDGFQDNLFLIDSDTGAATLITEIFPPPRPLPNRNQDIRGIVFLFDSIAIDIKPGSDLNSINPSLDGMIPVAILGSATFGVADIDELTLAFGSNGASFEHLHGPHFEDVNDDGFGDLLVHYRVEETGIAFGDAVACVTGEMLDGTPFKGCDVVRTVPDMDGDALLDEGEAVAGTDALNPDTDADGFEDGQEVLLMGTDPLDSLDPTSAQVRGARRGGKRRR